MQFVERSWDADWPACRAHDVLEPLAGALQVGDRRIVVAQRDDRSSLVGSPPDRRCRGGRRPRAVGTIVPKTCTPNWPTRPPYDRLDAISAPTSVRGSASWTATAPPSRSRCGRCRPGGSRRSSAGPAGRSTTRGDGRGGSGPTSPSVLPRPSGKSVDVDRSRITVESIAPAASTTARAGSSVDRPTRRRRTRPQRTPSPAARRRRDAGARHESEARRGQQRARPRSGSWRTRCHGAATIHGRPLAIGSAPMPWPRGGGPAHDCGPVRRGAARRAGHSWSARRGSRSRPLVMPSIRSTSS